MLPILSPHRNSISHTRIAIVKSAAQAFVGFIRITLPKVLIEHLHFSGVPLGYVRCPSFQCWFGCCQVFVLHGKESRITSLPVEREATRLHRARDCRYYCSTHWHFAFVCPVHDRAGKKIIVYAFLPVHCLYRWLNINMRICLCVCVYAKKQQLTARQAPALATISRAADTQSRTD